MSSKPPLSRAVELHDWQRKRSGWLGAQVDILLGARGEGDGRPVRHRPRSDEEWRAISDGVKALWRWRTRSGRWAWEAERVVRIDLTKP